MQFPKSKDPSVTFLNKYGYNVIKMPRTGIEPLQIIGRDETLKNLGSLSDIWTTDPDNPPPSPGKPEATVDVNGMTTDALDVSFGLSLLANVLSAFGATVPSLKTAYRSAHTVNFAYTDVTTTSIKPFAVGKYLRNGTLETNDPQVQHYFFNENAKAYLILDVLKSDSITVTATDSHGNTVGVDVPAIEGVVGANVTVKTSSSSNSAITFKGPVALTFGFAVQQITRIGDTWGLQGVKPSGSMAFAIPPVGAPADAPNPMIFDTGASDCCIDI